MRVRPWMWVLLVLGPCFALLACGDSSDEVAELRAQVAELQAQTATTTSRAPATTVQTGEFSAEELAYITREVNRVGAFEGLGISLSRSEVTCLAEEFVRSLGIGGFEALSSRLDSAVILGGGAQRADALAIMRTVTTCTDLVASTKGQAKLDNPRLDVDCIFRGVTESDIAGWYEDYYILGEQALRAHVANIMSVKIPLCHHTFTWGERSALETLCGHIYYENPNWGTCRFMVGRAIGGITLPPLRTCDYEDVKAWITRKIYEDSEWPVFIERECGPWV